MTINIYLHIGLHRTGTTYLQKNLFRVREHLKEYGYCYPTAGTLRAAGHHNLPASLRRGTRIKSKVGSLEDALDEICNSGCPNGILSSEEFCHLPNGKIASLRASLGDTVPTIIFTVRNQADAICSMYARALARYELRNAQKFVDDMLQNDKRLTYDTLIEPWAKHFGRNHVRIAVYEEISGNLFASMAAVFDLKLGPEEIDILGVSSKPVHVSPSKGTLILNRLAARTAKRLGVSRMDYMTKVAPQIRMIGERLSLTGSSRDLLSPVQRANIIKHYRPSNERFSKIWRSLPDVYFGN